MKSKNMENRTLAVLSVLVLALAACMGAALAGTSDAEETASEGTQTEYTVTILDKDAKTLKTFKVADGEKLSEAAVKEALAEDLLNLIGLYTAPEFAEKNAYDFAAAVSADLSLYAATSVLHIVNILDKNGAALGSAKVADGEKLTVDAVKEAIGESYSLKGLYTDADLKTAYEYSSEVKADASLYAEVVPVYKVTLLDEDGKVITTLSVESGQKLSKTAVIDIIKEKHTYKGLYTAPEFTDENAYDYSTPVTKDVSLYVDEISLDLDDNDNDVLPIALIAVGIILLIVGLFVHPGVTILGILLAIVGVLDLAMGWF